MSKHKVSHFEIPTSNMKKSKEFYQKIFDWKLDDMGDMEYRKKVLYKIIENMEYCMATTTDSDDDGMPTEMGGINGGFYKRESKKDGPSFVIETDDIEATAAVIEMEGGKITNPKHEIGKWGFMADFTDPDGNEIGLWEKAK